MATITETNGGLDVCREALVLLRQDRELPVSSGALDASSDVVAKKVDRVYDSTRALIIGAHGWDGLTLDEHGDAEDIMLWPRQIRAAFVALLARELAIPVTGRQEDLKAMYELYTMKLGEAIRKDFEEAVGKETEKLPLAVYAVCKGYLKENEPPPWGWGAFKKRVANAAVAAKVEIEGAHGWHCPFKEDPKDWRWAAFERLVTAKMAASVGAGVEQQNLMFQAYRRALDEAAARNWRVGLAGEQDGVVRDVLVGMRGHTSDTDSKDWDYRAMRECIISIRDKTRKEVLEERDWNFARKSTTVAAAQESCDRNALIWNCPIPHDCLKIHSVEGKCGTLAKDGWWIEDGFLKCRDGEPYLITYTADVKNVDRWDSVVREAYFTLMMRKVAMSSPNVNVRVQALAAEYAELLRKAALKDAKETQPGRVCWGPNDYADRIRGRGMRDEIRGMSLRRGGYVR